MFFTNVQVDTKDLSRIGASEVPILMGQSSRTVLDLYRKYTGDPCLDVKWPRRKRESSAVRLGRGARKDGHTTGQLLEEPLTRTMSILTGWPITLWQDAKTRYEPSWILKGGGTGGDDTMIHPGLPFMRATPDGFVDTIEGPALLEVKTSIYAYPDLRHSPYYPQIQATLMVCALDTAYLLEGQIHTNPDNLVTACGTRWTYLPAHPAYQTEIERRVNAFFFCVQTHTVPAYEDFDVYTF